MNGRPRRVLAVGSGGGHWVELWRMRPAWSGCRTTYVTTNPGYRGEVLAAARREGEDGVSYVTVIDASRWQKLRLVVQLAQIGAVVARVRPDVVVSTGATCGFLALALGKLLGARTVWVDSIANADELSMSGRKAARFADLYLTQWPHLAGSMNPATEEPRYQGSVV